MKSLEKILNNTPNKFSTFRNRVSNTFKTMGIALGILSMLYGSNSLAAKETKEEDMPKAKYQIVMNENIPTEYVFNSIPTDTTNNIYVPGRDYESKLQKYITTNNDTLDVLVISQTNPKKGADFYTTILDIIRAYVSDKHISNESTLKKITALTFNYQSKEAGINYFVNINDADSLFNIRYLEKEYGKEIKDIIANYDLTKDIKNKGLYEKIVGPDRIISEKDLHVNILRRGNKLYTKTIMNEGGKAIIPFEYLKPEIQENIYNKGLLPRLEKPKETQKDTPYINDKNKSGCCLVGNNNMDDLFSNIKKLIKNNSNINPNFVANLYLNLLPNQNNYGPIGLEFKIPVKDGNNRLTIGIESQGYESDQTPDYLGGSTSVINAGTDTIGFDDNWNPITGTITNETSIDTTRYFKNVHEIAALIGYEMPLGMGFSITPKGEIRYNITNFEDIETTIGTTNYDLYNDGSIDSTIVDFESEIIRNKGYDNKTSFGLGGEIEKRFENGATIGIEDVYNFNKGNSIKLKVGYHPKNWYFGGNAFVGKNPRGWNAGIGISFSPYQKRNISKYTGGRK